MSNFNFKVGDKVYYPREANKILTTQYNNHNNYPLFVQVNMEKYNFTSDGKEFVTDSNPSVFPATQEWYEKLVQIYPDLETGKAIIDFVDGEVVLED